MWTSWQLHAAKEELSCRTLGVLRKHDTTLLLLLAQGTGEDISRAETLVIDQTTCRVSEVRTAPVRELNKEDRALLGDALSPQDESGTLCLLVPQGDFPIEPPQRMTLHLREGWHEVRTQPLRIPAQTGLNHRLSGASFAIEQIHPLDGATLLLYEIEENTQLRFTTDAPLANASGAIGVFLKPQTGRRGHPLQQAILPCEMADLRTLTVTALLKREPPRAMTFCAADD